MNVNSTSRDVLVRQLLDLGVQPGAVLLVHTAFSRVGPVEGGPSGLIAALRDALGAGGTLVMPSMSSDDDNPFDPKTSPCPDMGVVAETFWRSPDVLRSDSPHAYIATFHGMPQAYLEHGDPYHCQCQKTSRLLRSAMGWPEDKWLTTFQSRFGNDPWLQPYTDETVTRLAKDGVKRLVLVAPGFSADCLETLEELDGENRHYFEENGGQKYAYLPALNDSEEGLRVIENIVRRELKGWI